MKLQEIFDQLTYGELSNLNIGGVPEGGITECNWASVMASINLGLTALYKRFNMKDSELVLLLQPGQYVYPLESKYAVANARSTAPVKWIQDSVAAPFLDDILKIQNIKADDCELDLNSGLSEYTVSTPAYNVVRIPKEIVDNDADLPDHLKNLTQLVISYDGKHRQLDPNIGVFDPPSIEVDLPYSHLQALLLFVASRFNNPIGLVNEFNAGNNYNAKYEAECRLLENNGLEIDQNVSHNKLQNRGFV